MSVYDEYPRNVWLEVDLGQFRRNVEAIQKISGTRVLVVVKANAYGHGLVPCGLAAQEAGAHMLGVATLAESGLLLKAGVTIPIMRVTAYGLDEIEGFIRQGIHFFVWTKEHIKEAQRAAQKAGTTARVHLKIDTGMGRSGTMPDQAGEIADIIQSCKNVELTGVCSHFHSADFEEESRTLKQIEIFNGVLDTLERRGINPDYIHIANSPGLTRFPQARFTMVRSGIITYGIHYERGFSLPVGVKSVGEWKARVVSVKTLPPGHVISYAAKYTTQGYETIAMLPVGYADGFRRYPDHVNQVLIKGRRVKVVGRVCMDQCMVRIPDDMSVNVGEEAVLMGGQGSEYIDSLDIADWWGTNNYDVVAEISHRVPRVYKE